MNLLLGHLPPWAALIPFAAYMAAIGWLHSRRRPVALSGPFDAVLLAAGLSGLVVIGPLAVVQPALGTSPWAAAMLLLVFAIVVACGILAARPRLVVYNVSLDQIRPLVAEVVASIDQAARWAGETVALPGRELQVHMDGRGIARTVSLVAVGSRTSAESWAEFSRRMRRAVRGQPVRSSPWAMAFFGAALITAVLAGGLAVWPERPAAPATGPAPMAPGAGQPSA